MNFLNVLLNILLIKFSVKIISIKKRNRRRDYTPRTKIPKLINLVFENFRSRYRRYTHEKKKKIPNFVDFVAKDNRGGRKTKKEKRGGEGAVTQTCTTREKHPVNRVGSSELFTLSSSSSLLYPFAGKEEPTINRLLPSSSENEKEKYIVRKKERKKVMRRN